MIPENFKKKSIFQGFIYFTHFNQRLDILQSGDLIYDYVCRCAAGRFKTNFPKFDHFIPIIYNQNSIGLILIRIENKFDLTKTKLESIAKDLTFDYFKSDEKSEYDTDIELNDDNCFKILISLGTDHNEVFYSSDTLIINGIKAFNIEDEIINEFQNILNFSRSDTNSYLDDQDVARTVTHGCASEIYIDELKKRILD